MLQAAVRKIPPARVIRLRWCFSEPKALELTEEESGARSRLVTDCRGTDEARRILKTARGKKLFARTGAALSCDSPCEKTNSGGPSRRATPLVNHHENHWGDMFFLH